MNPRHAPFVVGLLSVAYLLAIVDRTVLSLLIEPIKSDLHLSDTQVGLLAGLAFGLFYTVMGIPLGRLADRAHRPAVIAAGVLLWSLATMACGLASTFLQLFVIRVVVGVGEASISPAAYSLIADYVPRPRLGRAMSYYMLGTVVGLGVAWAIGGQIIRALGQLGPMELPLLHRVQPWQAVFLMVGLPGIVVAPLLLLIAEPRRTSEALRHDPASTGAGMAALGGQLRAGGAVYTSLFVGMAAVNTYGFALVTWAPALFHRQFGWSIGHAGTVLGIGIMLAGAAGMIGGGHLVDRLTRRGMEDAPLRLLFVVTLLMVPVGILGPLVPSGNAAAALFVVPVMGLFFAVIACAPTAIQIATPRAMRSSVSAAYLFVVNIVAYAVGPIAVGFVSDHLPASGRKLAIALSIMAVASLPAGAVALSLGLAPFRRLVRELAAEPSVS